MEEKATSTTNTVNKCLKYDKETILYFIDKFRLAYPNLVYEPLDKIEKILDSMVLSIVNDYVKLDIENYSCRNCNLPLEIKDLSTFIYYEIADNLNIPEYAKTVFFKISDLIKIKYNLKVDINNLVELLENNGLDKIVATDSYTYRNVIAKVFKKR